MAYKIITPPTVEPITAAEFRIQERLDPMDTLEDAAIAGYIAAARDYAEQFLGFALAVQTVEIALDAYPSAAIALPGGEVSAVESVRYIDAAGVEQTLPASLYALDNYSTPNWLLAAYGTQWPATLPVPNAVKVRYTIGAAPVAPAIKSAMMLMACDLYANRENTVIGVSVSSLPIGALALMQLYRVGMGV